MVRVHFKSDDGIETVIEAAPGASLMSAAVRNHVPGIDAICGGSMVCGTCHVYVDHAWEGRLPEPSQAEREVVEFGLYPRPNSRLACQIAVGPELEGLVVTTPPSQQ